MLNIEGKDDISQKNMIFLPILFVKELYWHPFNQFKFLKKLNKITH